MTLTLKERKKLLITLMDNYTNAIVKIFPNGKELRLIHKDGSYDSISLKKTLEKSED